MVYLDFNASTPLSAEVAQAMSDVEQVALNPGSIQHKSGQMSQALLENARKSVSDLLGFSQQELIFTSGASEGTAITILGVLAKLPLERRGIILSSTEHKAVIHAAETARKLFNARVVFVDVDESGILNFEELESLLASGKYGIVAVMHSNNETGVIQDTEHVSQLAHKHGAVFFCDVTQSIGKEDLGQVFSHSDFAVFSAHKFYGPKGSGALYATRNTQKMMQPLMVGGGQERGLRGGTPNVAGIVGLRQALNLAMSNLEVSKDRFRLLANTFRSGLSESLVEFIEIGSGASRLENTMNLRVLGVDADILMSNMPDVEISTGSACNSAVVEPSHVLLAHGLSAEEASQCIRVSFGTNTSVDEVNFAVKEIAIAVAHIRQNELAVQQ